MMQVARTHKYNQRRSLHADMREQSFGKGLCPLLSEPNIADSQKVPWSCDQFIDRSKPRSLWQNEGLDPMYSCKF